MERKTGNKPGGADHISGRFQYQDPTAFKAGTGNQGGSLSTSGAIAAGNQVAAPVAFVPLDSNWNIAELVPGQTYELTMTRIDDVGT